MDVDIQEMTSEVTTLDTRTLKSEIITEVMRLIEEQNRQSERLKQERGLRTSALSRPPVQR